MSVDALCETASVRLSARSGGGAVLVDQPAETVGPLGTIRAFGPPRDQVGDRSLEVGPAVRALVVVVLDELPENAVEVAFSADEHPVQALGPRCPDKAFGQSVRPRRPDRGADDPGAHRAHHLVKRPDELRIAVTNKEADGSRLVFQGGGQVACWVTQGPTGWAVTPAKKTLRRSRSMKNRT